MLVNITKALWVLIQKFKVKMTLLRLRSTLVSTLAMRTGRSLEHSLRKVN
ncbi:unnamed protein product [Rodentolepis nana]|uniref:Uncharacterized protein n=1 Tax=Rodentolepis nana TaxID=102285 RepID=A0A0R3TPK3_RODNA|nr:unnamed protein product [Rodentolepis nana]